MSKEITIQLTKCRIVLTETQLWALLNAKPDIARQAIRRGKGELRADRVEQYYQTVSASGTSSI